MAGAEEQSLMLYFLPHWVWIFRQQKHVVKRLFGFRPLRLVLKCPTVFKSSRATLANAKKAPFHSRRPQAAVTRAHARLLELLATVISAVSRSCESSLLFFVVFFK